VCQGGPEHPLPGRRPLTVVEPPAVRSRRLSNSQMDLGATSQWQADRHTSRPEVPLPQQPALPLWQGDLDLWLLHKTASSKVLHTMQRGAEHHVGHGVGEECRRHGSLPNTLNL
jgi:hypothetical protein